MTEAALQQYIQAIRPADRTVMDAARKRQAELAKPPGSLGALEDMSIRLAGITGQVCPKMDSCRVAVFAADNGVVDEGVSCAPRSVTLQQAINMTRRRTGMSAMAAAFGDDVAVVDVGIAADVPGVSILDRKVRRGTGNSRVSMRESGSVEPEDGRRRLDLQCFQSIGRFRRGFGDLPDGAVGAGQLRELNALEVVAHVAPSILAGVLDHAFQ